jgi:PAS domain S-box-containing protein
VIPTVTEREGRDGTTGYAVCILGNGAAADALADAGMTVHRAAAWDDVASRFDDQPPDCLVVDPARIERSPGAFRSAVRDRARACPVVWLADDADALDAAAFGRATTVVERAADPENLSFLVEKVRAAIDDRTVPAHGPAKYRMLVESARDGLYILDAHATVTYLNESFAEILGYERSELLGSNASLTMAEGELERGQRLVQELLASDSRESEVIDMEMERKDGDHITVSINFVVLTDDGNYEGLMGVVRDITERKARERELERYETIVETTTEPIYVLDADERFVRVNDAMTQELGYDRETLLGGHVSMVTDEAGVRRHETLIEEPVEGERERVSPEVEMETADGRRRQYAISLAVIREDGGFGGTVVTAHEVTALREHQRQLSVLDRVLRHNVRNKMSVVLGHATDIGQAATGEIADRAASIEAAATELLELSDSARDFESVFAADAPRPVAIDAAGVGRDVVQELRLEHPEATVTASLTDGATALGHETFELALNELVENAIVHNDTDAPSVDVSLTEGDDAVEIRVADDGPGLDETDRKALLRGAESPLEHTQGLGLWFVRWTVEIADGEVHIADNEPRGTVVTITLQTPSE